MKEWKIEYTAIRKDCGYSDFIKFLFIERVQLARVYENHGVLTCPYLSNLEFKNFSEISKWIEERFGIVAHFLEKE